MQAVLGLWLGLLEVALQWGARPVTPMPQASVPAYSQLHQGLKNGGGRTSIHTAQGTKARLIPSRSRPCWELGAGSWASSGAGSGQSVERHWDWFLVWPGRHLRAQGRG